MKDDTITAAELHEAAQRLADAPVPTFADPGVQAAIAEQAVVGQAFSMALADARASNDRGLNAGGYLRLAADLRLEQTVARLCATFQPGAADVAKLRQHVHEYALHLSMSGPSYEDALQQIEDAFSGLWVDDLEGLRERLEQVAVTVPVPRELSRVDFEAIGERIRACALSETAHDRRAERLRKAKPSQLGRGLKNKYAARPPGKR